MISKPWKAKSQKIYKKKIKKMETTLTTSGADNNYGYGNGYGNLYGKLIDRMGTYAQSDAKDKSDIAQRQASDLFNSQALIAKDFADNASSTALQNAIAMKALTDATAGNLAQMTAFERDTNNRLHETRHLLAKETQDNARYVMTDAHNNLLDIKTDVNNLAKYTADAITSTRLDAQNNTALILQQMAKDKYDSMKDKIDALRERREYDREEYGRAFQSQEINSLKQMINSVEQNQRFSSKTVQFGTGNTSGTAQTGNQA